MSMQKLIALAIIASCHASGIGHVYPAFKSFPIVRYAPFFNFPTGARSIHAVAPPAPLLPAPVPAPVLPASPPFLPAPAPAPFFPAPSPFLPAPAFPAPAYPAPVIAPAAPLPPPVPVFSGSFPYPALPRLAPYVPALPRLAPYVPTLPRIAPVVPALPQQAFYPSLPLAPFSPIVRAVAPAPVLPPAPITAAKLTPYSYPAYAPNIPYGPAPVISQAWKK